MPLCFIALPHSTEFEKVRKAIVKAAEAARFRTASFEDENELPANSQEFLLSQLARADCLVADVTGRNPNVLFELGFAQAMAKGIFLLARAGAEKEIPSDVRRFQSFSYKPDSNGLAELAKNLSAALRLYRRSPSRLLKIVWDKQVLSSFAFQVTIRSHLRKHLIPFFGRITSINPYTQIVALLFPLSCSITLQIFCGDGSRTRRAGFSPHATAHPGIRIWW